MIWIDSHTETSRSNDTAWLSIAAVLHAVILFWNPILFQTAWKTFTAPGDGGIVILDVPGAETPALPGKPSLRPLGLPSSSNISASPILPRHSYPVIPAGIPFKLEQDLATITRPNIPIAIGNPESSSQASSQKPALLENRRPSLAGLIPGGLHDLSGREGGGHILIRTEAPVEMEKAETHNPRQNIRESSQIEGPLSHRGVLHKVIPDYPAWAEEQGVIGTVRLYFNVTSKGAVQNDVSVRFTSGSPELDRLAIDALRQWRFVPSASGGGSQWGVITFFFSLARNS